MPGDVTHLLGAIDSGEPKAVARTGQAVTEPLRHADRVFSAQFSPDGLQVVMASEDKVAHVWEISPRRFLSRNGFWTGQKPGWAGDSPVGVPLVRLDYWNK